MSNRTGPVHHYMSFAYLLQTDCKMWHRGDETQVHFSTCWEHVTCAACQERKPLSKKTEAAVAKLEKFNKENAQ